MKITGTRLWRDTRGSTSVIALILIVTIVAVGAIVGLSTIRDQIVQEFADLGVSLNQLNHSFSYTINVDVNGDGDFADMEDQTLTRSYTDTTVGTLTDTAGDAPACLTISPP
jgi:Flp pilus assembly pilin Flp